MICQMMIIAFKKLMVWSRLIKESIEWPWPRGELFRYLQVERKEEILKICLP